MPKIVDGTTYGTDTPEQVIAILERSRKTKLRIHVHYGYTKIGPDHKSDKGLYEDWLEEYETTGHVGRTTGPNKCPIMLPNSRSMGGGIINDGNIIRIRTTQGQELYRHPEYKQGTATVHDIDETHHDRRYLAEVKVNGMTHAKFATRKAADRWMKKMGFTSK